MDNIWLDNQIFTTNFEGYICRAFIGNMGNYGFSD
jgi:hypothetical protein